MRLAILLVTLAMLAGSASAGDPKQAAVHNKLGKAYFEAKQFDDAIREFKASYDADQKPVTLFKIASAYYQKADYKGAIEFYTKYLAADPQGPYAEEAANFSAVASKALAAEEANKKAADEAARVEAERKATEAEAERKRVAGMVHIKQAEAYGQAGAWTSAGDEYTAAAEAAANPELLLDAATAYKKQPDNAKARAALLAYLDKVPLGPRSEGVRAEVASLTTMIDKTMADERARLALEKQRTEERIAAQLGQQDVVVGQRSYRKRTITYDIIGDALVILAFGLGDQPFQNEGPTSGGRALLFYTGTFITLGAAPITHWRHGNDSRAVASGLGRLIAIATGTFVAIGQGHTAYLDPEGFIYVAIPMIGIQTLDAIFFAKEAIRGKKPAASVFVMPGPHGGATVGLGGAF